MTRSEIASLRKAHDEFRELMATVQRITERNPHGLQIAPLFSRKPQPVSPVFRHQPWKEAA